MDRPVLVSGLYAGLAAGLILALLIATQITPLILQAEKYETGVLRDAETGRTAGNVIGTVLLGSIYGLVLAILFNFISFAGNVRWRLAPVIGVGGWIVVNLIPSLLANPPMPPGVESLLPVSTRQFWWSALIFFEFIGLGAGYYVFKSIKAGGIVRWAASIATFLGVIIIPVLLKPAENYAPTDVPAELISRFQLLSSLSMLAFWLVMGGVFVFTLRILRKGD